MAGIVTEINTFFKAKKIWATVAKLQHFFQWVILKVCDKTKAINNSLINFYIN